MTLLVSFLDPTPKKEGGVWERDYDSMSTTNHECLSATPIDHTQQDHDIVLLQLRMLELPY